ncbi:hypothetical protein ACFQ1S_07205 [Kibdelosporangium lantanae]|uniref:WYL domain-containing protein n=1 Tax=Kibdelosporangium lantanae TaxID=1497396 RepID=A0ABW3M3Y3_9PSEU
MDAEMRTLAGWGRTAPSSARVLTPTSVTEVVEALREVTDRGVVVEIRYPDHSQVRTVPARSTRGRFRYADDDQEVWVGGTGHRMVVAYPRSVVPVMGVGFRRRPLARTPRGKQPRKVGTS